MNVNWPSNVCRNTGTGNILLLFLHQRPKHGARMMCMRYDMRCVRVHTMTLFLSTITATITRLFECECAQMCYAFYRLLARATTRLKIHYSNLFSIFFLYTHADKQTHTPHYRQFYTKHDERTYNGREVYGNNFYRMHNKS